MLPIRQASYSTSLPPISTWSAFQLNPLSHPYTLSHACGRVWMQGVDQNVVEKLAGNCPPQQLSDWNPCKLKTQFGGHSIQINGTSFVKATAMFLLNCQNLQVLSGIVQERPTRWKRLMLTSCYLSLLCLLNLLSSWKTWLITLALFTITLQCTALTEAHGWAVPSCRLQAGAPPIRGQSWGPLVKRTNKQ